MQYSRISITLFALFQALLLAALCLDVREDRKFPYVQTNDDPPMALVVLFWGGICTTLGIRIDTNAVAKVLPFHSDSNTPES